MNHEPLTIRTATDADAGTLRRLAQLDSSPPLRGHVLLAEAGDVVLAAISLETGAAAADPFLRSGDAMRMLTHRRYRIMRQGGDVGQARSLLRRLAPIVRLT
jgi:hypothetical protein